MAESTGFWQLRRVRHMLLSTWVSVSKRSQHGTKPNHPTQKSAQIKALESCTMHHITVVSPMTKFAQSEFLLAWEAIYKGSWGNIFLIRMLFKTNSKSLFRSGCGDADTTAFTRIPEIRALVISKNLTMSEVIWSTHLGDLGHFIGDECYRETCLHRSGLVSHS